MAKNNTQLICEGLQNTVFATKDARKQRDAKERYNDVLSHLWRSSNQNPAYEGERLRFSELDWDQLIHAWRKGDERTADVFSRARRGIRLDESDAVGMTQFGDFVNTCVRMGTFEMCDSPSVAPILSLVSRLDVGLENLPQYTSPTLVEFDLPEMTDDAEETPSFGIGDVFSVKRPEPTYIRFKAGLRRSILLTNATEIVRDVMRQGAELMDRRMAEKIIYLIFDAYYSGDNMARFNWDDVQYDNYLTSGGPWTNLYGNTADLDNCEYGPILAVEDLVEDAVSPVTGLPMECMNSLDVLTTSQAQKRYFDEMLGAHVRRNNDGAAGCSTEREFNLASRSGWSGNNVYSKYVRHYLRPRYTELYGSGTTTNANAAEIETMLDRTFAAGNFREAYGWQVHWDREVFERGGQNTQEYFDHDVIWQIRYSERAGEFTRSPWAAVKVQGLKDGGSLPLVP